MKRLYYSKKRKSLMWRIQGYSLDLKRFCLVIVLPLTLISILVSNIPSSRCDDTLIEDVIIEQVEQTLEEGMIDANEVIESDIVEEEPVSLDYRLTYYYSGDATDSGDCTSSGLCVNDFDVNENGWFTYKGKLVVATANKVLLKWSQYKSSNQKLFNLYDELTLNINGEDYDAIVLDVCGACMLDEKIDLYVSNRLSGIDTNITVVEKD